MENRATKSGIARDVQQKIAGKYDKEAAATAMAWVARVTGENIDTSGDADKVFEDLKDGYVLVKLANTIKPGSISANKMKRFKMPFQQMELINMFNEAMKRIGVRESCCFATADLFEKQNMTQVITCLESTARACLSDSIPVEGYGPKESEANVRNFTEEQLAQGKNIIGLQMGSNKGATQSGQNFGKGRMIVD